MCGRGKLPFGQALFKYVKFTETLHFSFFFFTTIVLASQSGYFTSRIDLAFKSFSTSSLTPYALSRPSFLLFS